MPGIKFKTNRIFTKVTLIIIFLFLIKFFNEKINVTLLSSYKATNFIDNIELDNLKDI